MDTLATPAGRLAQWVIAHSPSRPSNLKLQKLCFYSYGAACAFNFVDELGGPIAFKRWKHGPVVPALYHEYKQFGVGPVPPATVAVSYSNHAESHLRDVLTVYGSLDAWKLSLQSHLETPWRVTPSSQEICDRDVREHFRAKFASDVAVPEYISRASSAQLDGLPDVRYSSLHALAESLSTIRSA